MAKSIHKFIDIYCGAGGFSLGFHLTGRFKSILAVDNLKPVALTYKTNFPHSTVIIEDVKNLTKDV
ncbi:MAG: DNA cytosine methyltransferase, partial [Desulfurococcaceae archaeon]